MAEYRKTLILSATDGTRFIVRSGDGIREVAGLGVVDTGRLSAALAEAHIAIAGKGYFVGEASLPDILALIKRGPQIILPKDAVQIVMGCGIGPGKRVLEVGTGSGALTIALAHFVGAGGKVVTYESNPKHADIARRNIVLAGMSDIVEIREADASSCGDIGAYSAAVMDMPEPWNIMEAMADALVPGGYTCAYVPTMNQAESAIKSMRALGLAETHVLENIQREIVVGEGGTRPSFEMLGHTGYLCFGRKVRGKGP